jgi:hypothetical protein
MDRTERIIESDHGFAPVTWTLDSDRVEFIWGETEAVFGNTMWFDSIFDAGIPVEWHDEFALRADTDLYDAVSEAVGDLDPDHADPSLVFLGLKEMFGRYGVTLEIEPHPEYGDVIALAQECLPGRPLPDYPPATWTIHEERVVALWDDIENLKTPYVVGMFLSDDQQYELWLRGGTKVPIAVMLAVQHLDKNADPSLAFLAVHEYFSQPYKGDVTFEFAPHPVHGDVLERARRIVADARAEHTGTGHAGQFRSDKRLGDFT